MWLKGKIAVTQIILTTQINVQELDAVLQLNHEKSILLFI